MEWGGRGWHLVKHRLLQDSIKGSEVRSKQICMMWDHFCSQKSGSANSNLSPTLTHSSQPDPLNCRLPFLSSSFVTDQCLLPKMLPQMFSLLSWNRRITSLREMTSVSPEKISTPLPVAGVVQMTTSNDKESNWLQGKALVEKACSLGAQVFFSFEF